MLKKINKDSDHSCQPILTTKETFKLLDVSLQNCICQSEILPSWPSYLRDNNLRQYVL